MRYLLALISFLLAVPLPATAQEDEKPRTCRILFLSAPADAPKSLYLYDGLKSIEVDLPRMNLSKVHTLPSGPLTLTLLNQAVDDPASVPAEAPSVEVAAGLSDIYLLVTSDPSNPVVPVSLAVVDANHDRIGKGEMLWINQTDKNIEGNIGSRKLRMYPRDAMAIKAPARGRENYPVEIYYTIPGEKEVYPLCETVWRHDPRSRNLVFIIEDQKRKAPRILSFNDFRG